jgi:carboxymethylenebutenolidase
MRTVNMLVLSMFPLFAIAQSGRSCCGLTSSQHGPGGPAQMALFANDAGFVRMHEAPPPISFSPETGTFVRFRTADTAEGRGYEVKSPTPSGKYVFMFHEWWGLNEYIQREAENLQKALGNVTVLAIDLYDGKVAKTPDEAGKMSQSVSGDRARSIIRGALAYVGEEARIATIGWCFGGGWSHQASLTIGRQAVACVIYYGMPEMDVEKLKTSDAPVLGIFAKQDAWISPERVNEFERAMKEAGKQLTVKMYDAMHAFANPSNPKHDKKAADDANKHTVEFLKKNLLR